MGCHFAPLNRTHIACNYLAFMGVLGCTGMLHLMCCMDVYLKIVLQRNCYLCKTTKSTLCTTRLYRNERHVNNNYYTSVIEIFSHLNYLHKHCTNMTSNHI